MPNHDIETLQKAVETRAQLCSIFDRITTFATLNIYEAGVGIFSLTLDCPENAIQPNDLLALNDLGRRLYPKTLNFRGIESARNSGLLPGQRVFFF